MQRVEEELAHWKSLVRETDDAWAKFREADRLADVDAMDHYATEAHRLGLACQAAHQRVQAALAERLSRQAVGRQVDHEGRIDERIAARGKAQIPGWRA
jgi:hypothetical protein